MNKLTLVADERESSTLRAALLLLEEQIDALLEALAEMIGQHRPPVTATEIELLSARIDRQTNTASGFPNREYLSANAVVEIDRALAVAIPR